MLYGCVSIVLVHEGGVLSFWTLMSAVTWHKSLIMREFSRVCTVCPSASHCSRIPANSRSLLVISPFGFEKDTSHSLMLAGNANYHTISCMDFVLLSQTPPPNLQVSMYPMYYGSFGSNSMYSCY
jgi:hypothetical protein